MLDLENIKMDQLPCQFLFNLRRWLIVYLAWGILSTSWPVLPAYAAEPVGPLQAVGRNVRRFFRNLRSRVTHLFSDPPSNAPNNSAALPLYNDLQPLLGVQYFGLYMDSHKVGFMRSEMGFKAGGLYLIHDAVARIGGMGKKTEVKLYEERHYALSGLLEEVRFRQMSDTGTVEIFGYCQGGNLIVEIEAGGSKHSSLLPCIETVQDALAAELMAQAKTPVSLQKVHRFDVTVQKNIEAHLQVTARESRQAAGIPMEVLQVQTRYPEMSVMEYAWFDHQGQLLDAKIGGFLEAKAEPEAIAKKLGTVQDILMKASVALPAGESLKEHARVLQLVWQGFGDFEVPISSRQTSHSIATIVPTAPPATVASKPKHQAHKDPKLPSHVGQHASPKPAAEQESGFLDVQGQKPLLAMALHAETTPKSYPFTLSAAGSYEPSEQAPFSLEAKAALGATAFIQSDDAELIAAAKKITQNANDLFDVSNRLLHFVYGYLQKVYIPAYSNALEAWHSRKGDCTEHSVLMVALARAVGIPARVAVGLVYWPPSHGFGWHAWVEIWTGDRFIEVDPTWDQFLVDATHVKLAHGGPAEQARVAMLMGQLRLISVQ